VPEAVEQAEQFEGVALEESGMVIRMKAGSPTAGWMRLAVMVARPASRVARLCRGAQSAVCLVASLASAAGNGGRGRPGWAGLGGPGGGEVVVFEQHGRELALHVPGHVAGEHADQHVGAYPVGEPVADGSDQQVGVQAAERPLDVFQGLVGSCASSISAPAALAYA